MNYWINLTNFENNTIYCKDSSFLVYITVGV